MRVFSYSHLQVSEFSTQGLMLHGGEKIGETLAITLEVSLFFKMEEWT